MEQQVILDKIQQLQHITEATSKKDKVFTRVCASRSTRDQSEDEDNFLSNIKEVATRIASSQNLDIEAVNDLFKEEPKPKTEFTDIEDDKTLAKEALLLSIQSGERDGMTEVVTKCNEFITKKDEEEEDEDAVTYRNHQHLKKEYKERAAEICKQRNIKFSLDDSSKVQANVSQVSPPQKTNHPGDSAIYDLDDLQTLTPSINKDVHDNAIREGKALYARFGETSLNPEFKLNIVVDPNNPPSDPLLQERIIQHGLDKVIEVRALLDTGAEKCTMSLSLEPLLSPSNTRDNIVISCSGSQTKSERRAITIKCPDGLKVKQVGNCTSLGVETRVVPPDLKNFLENGIRIPEYLKDKFHWCQSEGNVEILCGIENGSLVGRMLSSKEVQKLGIFIPLSCPFLSIYYAKEALKPLAFSGVVGIPPDTIPRITYSSSLKQRLLNITPEELCSISEGSYSPSPQFCQIRSLNSETVGSGSETEDDIFQSDDEDDEAVKRGETWFFDDGIINDEDVSNDHASNPEVNSNLDVPDSDVSHINSNQTTSAASSEITDMDMVNFLLDPHDKVSMMMYNQAAEMEKNISTRGKLCRHHEKEHIACVSCGGPSNQQTRQSQQIFDRILDDIGIKYLPETDEHGEPKKQVVAGLITTNGLSFHDNFVKEGTTNEYYDGELDALRTVRSVERQLKRKRDLIIQYNELIDEGFEKGFFVKISREQFHAIPQPHYLLCSNIVHNTHSSSSSMRIIFDSSRPNIGGLSHSQRFQGPKKTLNSALQIVLASIVYEHSYACDISKYYHRISLKPESSFVSASIAPRINPDTLETEELIYRLPLCWLFGQAQAPSVCSASDIKFIASAATSKETKFNITSLKYSDDHLNSSSSPDEARRLLHEYRLAHAEYSMPIKPPLATFDVIPENKENPEMWTSDNFGKKMNWGNKTYTGSTKFSIYPMRKGMPSGPPLHMTDLNHPGVVLNYRCLLRLAGQNFEVCPRLTTPLQIAFRIKIKELLKLFPRGQEPDYDANIRHLDVKIEQNFRLFLSEVAYFWKKVSPISAFCVPSGYEICGILNTADGGEHGYCHAAYLQSRKVDKEMTGPDTYTYIIYSKCHLGSGSVPVMESFGFLLAMRNILMLVIYLRDKLPETLQIVSLSDSAALAFSFSWSSGVKNIKLKNNSSSLLESLDTITDLLPLSVIRCSTIPSECNSADLGTKLGDNPAKLASSRLWRFGHSIYEDTELLEKTEFLRAKGKERVYAQLNPSDLSSEEKKKLTVYSRTSERKSDQDYRLAPINERLEEPKLSQIPPPEEDTCGAIKAHDSSDSNQNSCESSNHACHNVPETDQTNILQDWAQMSPRFFTINSKEPRLDSELKQVKADLTCHTNVVRADLEEFIAEDVGIDSDKLHGICVTLSDSEDEPETNVAAIKVSVPNNNEIGKIFNLPTRKSKKKKIQLIQSVCESADPLLEELETFQKLSDKIKEVDRIRDEVYIDEISRPELYSDKDVEDSLPNVTIASENVTEENEPPPENQDSEDPPSCSYRPAIHESDGDSDAGGSTRVTVGSESQSNQPDSGLEELRDIWFQQVRSTRRHVIDPSKPTLSSAIMDKETYKRAVSIKYSTFMGKLKAVGFLYLLTLRKLYKENGRDLLKEENQWVIESACILLRSDQAHFPPGKTNDKNTVVTDPFNVICRQHNLDDAQAFRIFGGMYLPVLAYESPLLDSIFMYYHQQRSPLHSIRPVHVGHLSSAAALHAGVFAVTTIAITRWIRARILRCVICRRSSSLLYNIRHGVSHGGLGGNENLFSHTFIDPISKLRVRFKPGPNGVVNLPILILVCAHSYCVEFELLHNSQRTSIQKALLNFQARTGFVFDKITADAAQVFQIQDRHILEGVPLHTITIRSQFQSLAEKKMHLVRKFLRMIFHVSGEEVIRTIVSLTDALAILHQMSTTLNLIPYSAFLSHQALSPDHLRRPGRYLQGMEKAQENHDKNMGAMDRIWSNMTQLHHYFVEVRNKIVQARADRFQRREKISSCNIDPKINDIAFFIDPVSKRAVLCKIVAIRNAKVTVFLCDTLEYKTIPTSTLRILLNERPENEEKDMDRDDDEDDVTENENKESVTFSKPESSDDSVSDRLENSHVE